MTSSRARYGKSKKVNTAKTKFTNLFFLILILGITCYAFMNSAFFKISKVQVVGNITFSSEEILMLSGINSNDNIFRVDLDRITSRIADSPKVKSVKASRKFPSTLRIHLVERVPIALVAYSNYYLEVDDQGVPMSVVEDLSKSKLPLLTGQRPAGLALGKPVKDEDFLCALRVPSSLIPQSLYSLSEINAENLNDVILYTVDGVKIRWGQAEDVKDKAKLLDSIVASLRSKAIKTYYIDLSVPKNPVIAGGVTKQ